LLKLDRLETRMSMLKAMNLVTRLAAGPAAIGGLTATGRALFMVPWRDRALFGTWESLTASTPEEARPSERDAASFLNEITRAFPGLTVSREDVTLVHCGVVPAVLSGDGTVTLEGRQQVRDHASGANAVDGLISVAGTKYTTARAVAEQIIDRVISKLGRPRVPSRTAETPLPQSEPWLELGRERPELAERVTSASPVTAAQLVWAVRHEMAVTLADAVIRRTSLGVLGHPGRSALERAAAIVAGEIEWDAARVAAEVRAVDDFFTASAPLGTMSW
jgi:glycerol-3-phosphate dehydrogenase